MELLHSLFEERSVLDRLRRQDRRIDSLERIAASREVRVVPDLMRLLAMNDSLAPHVARTISNIVQGITPVQLSWLDEQVRRASYAYHRTGAWDGLSPGAVSDLAATADFDPIVIGLLASHASGRQQRFCWRRSPTPMMPFAWPRLVWWTCG